MLPLVALSQVDMVASALSIGRRLRSSAVCGGDRAVEMVATVLGNKPVESRPPLPGQGVAAGSRTLVQDWGPRTDRGAGSIRTVVRMTPSGT
jgi:hypothetical protein